MRRFHLMILLMIFLQACSFTPVQESAATDTPTVIFTPSITRTVTVPPTITPSATIVHFPTADPNLSTATFIPIPIFTALNTITPVPTATSFLPGPGFLAVQISESKIFWGICKPNKSRVTAQVEDSRQVASVVIFVQVKSAKDEDYTPWTTGDVMFNNRDGTFSYNLQASEIEGHNNYKNSWARFQLVAVNDEGEEIGRTKIYTNSVAMSPCMCLEPLKGCPIVTPKPATPKP